MPREVGQSGDGRLASEGGVWFRDHAAPHMAVLMDPDGPFAPADATTETNHVRKGQPLPYQAPPEGLFPDVREANSASAAGSDITA